MITQIEIDGFKTFKDFKVELAPFQVIVGPNGSGKSNLFDALQLLSRLAETDLPTAFQAVRGYTNEQFTRLPNGKSENKMRFAVEMLVNREIQDESVKVLVSKDGFLQRQNELRYRRLRYEIEIAIETDASGLEKPYIASEKLRRIPRGNDSWSARYNLSPEHGWLLESGDRQEPFIDTESSLRDINGGMQGTFQHPSDIPLITIFREEGPNQSLGGSTTQYLARNLNRTTLNFITGIDYLHIMAAREEMLSWRFVHLNPESLRKSSAALTNQFAFLSPDGSNLPTMLARLQIEDEFALTDVSRDMANLVPGIIRIRVEKNVASNEYDIWAETSDRRTFSAKALSDGTLRLLALAAIRNDVQFHGSLCLEEPENGVEPLHLKTMALVLREMATDFSDAEQRDEPLRQVLITTHSPAFIGLPEIIDFLLFAHVVTVGGSDINSPLRITRMEPVVTSKRRSKKEGHPEKDRASEVYSIDSVRQYLARNNFNKADNKLKKARTLSLEQ